MKTLHAIQTDPTLLDFLKAAWPEWDPAYNPDGTITFWQGDLRGNTIAAADWATTYRRWVAKGAPPNAFEFAMEDEENGEDDEDEEDF